MKRAASPDFDHERENRVSFMASTETLINANVEKRARSGTPPLFVGPLVFSGNGEKLQQAVYGAEPSNMPGVHRSTSPQPSPPIRIWSPHLQFPNHIEANLDDLSRSINGQCVFIFDPASAPEQNLLNNISTWQWSFTQPLVTRYGLYCSRNEPVVDITGLPIPYVQDMSGVLAQLCKFHDYLGPTAVLTKNNQVVATCMSSRSPEAVAQIFNQWMSV